MSDKLDEELIPYLVDLDERNGIPPPRTKDQLLVYLTRVTVSLKKTVATLATEVTSLHQIVERLDEVTTTGSQDLRAIKKAARRRSDWFVWAVRTGVVLIAGAIGALFMYWLQHGGR